MMKKTVKQMGKLPVNSRITIDYTGKEPKVHFDYPLKSKKEISRQVSGSLPTIILAMFFALATGAILMLLYSHPTGDIAGCITSYNNYNHTTKIYGIYFKCATTDGIEREYYFDSSAGSMFGKYVLRPPTMIIDASNGESGTINGIINTFYNIGTFGSLIYLGGFVLLFYIYLKIFSLFVIKTKKGQEIFPELNRYTCGKGFHARIKKVPENKIVELPLFRNVYLDYKVTDDFCDNLQKVEIREHPFKYAPSGTYTSSRKKIKKSKMKKNVYLWNAKFYFAEVPKKGYLDLRWH